MSGAGEPLNALALRDAIAQGQTSSRSVVEACLSRISAREDDVGAWAWLDPDAALADAERCDASIARGELRGALHGLPVGLKDIIDTAGIPTENGCALDAGRVPAEDAEVVRRLKEAGAVILGKTITTELAFLHPGATRNPIDLAHTPGGSSSGSAAAVADGMVPLAIGTQTGGSVIRPASFCGVVGFKPSFNAIPKDGVLVQSPSLDTLGVFAADVESAALLAGAVMDGAVGIGTPSRAPRFAIVEPPAWERCDGEMRDGIKEICEALGAAVVRRSLPAIFEGAEARRRCLNFVEMAHHFDRYTREGDDALSQATQSAMEEGRQYRATEYLEALGARDALNAALSDIFVEVDALLCPASLGPAPQGLSSTGDSIMNGIWTLAGTPAVTLPLMKNSAGLPMGLQLVGQFGDDASLLSAANWLWLRRTER